MVNVSPVNCVECNSLIYGKKNSKPKVVVLETAPDVVCVEQAPKIGMWRIAFSRLTDEQIAQVNKTGKLPKNAKFIPDGRGGYMLVNNFFDVTHGTKQIPEGFELKNNVLGFTCIVPKGTEGIFLKEGAA